MVLLSRLLKRHNVLMHDSASHEHGTIYPIILQHGRVQALLQTCITEDKVFKMPAQKCEIYTYTLHVWRSCSVAFAFVGTSLPSKVTSPDLLKCTVQMEADLMPFCFDRIAYEYLLCCHRGFDRHLRCVKPKNGLCQMLGLYSVIGHQLRRFELSHVEIDSSNGKGSVRVTCCFRIFLSLAIMRQITQVAVLLVFKGAR